MSTRNLFEHWTASSRPIYPTLDAALGAVRARAKGMWMELFPLPLVDPRYRELATKAWRLGLTVIHQPVVEQRHVRVYVLHFDQAWRVEAHAALWKIFPAHDEWSWGAEALESHLLGYSEAQIAVWIGHRRWQRVASGTTIYLMMTPAQRAHVVALGGRCVPAAALHGGMTACWARGDRVVKRNAAALAQGLAIARTGIAPELAARLFGDPSRRRDRAIVTARIDEELTTPLNAALRSNVEFLARAGWVTLPGATRRRTSRRRGRAATVASRRTPSRRR